MNAIMLLFFYQRDRRINEKENYSYSEDIIIGNSLLFDIPDDRMHQGAGSFLP